MEASVGKPVLGKHLARELATIKLMTEMYCSGHHAPSAAALCDECEEFVDYIAVRLEKCPYGEDKPTCAGCPIHCYKPARKIQGRAIMMYSGPRMLLRHPLLLLAHKLDGIRKVVHPRELSREKRMSSRRK